MTNIEVSGTVMSLIVGIICAVQQISICLLILIRIHSIYIINTYIPLMDRVNSMVMVEKLKRTLAEELHEAPQQQIYKNKSLTTSVGTKNQVESFLVILDSG